MKFRVRQILFWTYFTHVNYVYSWHCKQWISTVDGKYRSHCYQYYRDAGNTTLEAEKTCKGSGGQLAPYVDDDQFRFWQDFLPDSNRGEIIIGVTDMVQEGVWAAFDGAPVQTLPWNRAQPNGGRKQNCVVINAEPPGFKDGEVFKLQDKNCSEAFDGFLCYRDEMCHTFTDGSKECFWFISNNLKWDFHDANAQCAEQDGVLASVTSFNQLDFLKAAFSTFISHSDVQMAWLGVYSVGNILRNVNSDDIPFGFPENTSTVNTNDMCLAITDSPLGRPSSTNTASGLSYVTEHLYPCKHTSVFAGICMKNKLGFRWFTKRNFTSATYFQNLLQIDKSKTTVEGMKTTCAYDDRTSSKSIGFVGVSVIVVVWLFVVFLDLGSRHKIPRKTKKKKRNKQIRP